MSELHKYAPTVDAGAVIKAGATAFRHIIQPEQLDGVLKGYSVAIDHNFYLAVGTATGSFLFCWGMGWRKVSKKETKSEEGV